MWNIWAPVPVSIVAFLTTIHAAIVVLRRQRSPGNRVSLVLLPAIAFSISPWFFQTPGGLAIGLLVHLIYFMACERLIPVATPQLLESRPLQPLAGAPVRAPASSMPSATTSRPAGFAPLPVLATFDESPSIRTFRLARPAGLSFEAGQFVPVRVQADGQQLVRCYSISSAPEASGYVEISVKRVGQVSGMLHATIRPGSLLAARSPAGKFTYPSQDDRPIVLVAGGVGITPLMSMLRHGVHAEPARPITLLYSARNEQEFAFRDELTWMARRHSQIRVVLTASADCSLVNSRVGRIDASFLRQEVPDAVGSVFMLCGPPDMIQATRGWVADMGVPASHIRFEVFQPAAAIGALTSPDTAVADGTAGDTGSAASRRDNVQLDFTRSRRQIRVDQRETLLDAAEKAGVGVPSLCRSGVCGTCRTKLVSGDVQCTSDTLSPSEREQGWVLPCVAWAKSDCSIDA